MYNEKRIKCYIGPIIESFLQNYDIDKLANYFNIIKNNFSLLNRTAIFVIPSEYIQVFISVPFLKIFWSTYAVNTQSNIIFAPTMLDSKCKCTAIENLFPDNSFAYTVNFNIINSLINYKEPIFIDIADSIVKKLQCSSCNEVIPCSVDWQGNVIGIDKIENINDIFKASLGKTIDYYKSKSREISEDDLRYLAFVTGMFHGFPVENLNDCTNIIVHESLLIDLRRGTNSDIEDIAFTMLRAVSMPSAQSFERCKFSVDWHKNTPYSLPDYNYKLYRVDVVKPTRTGITASGINRLLMAKTDSKTVFLLYTEQHDFNIDSVRARLKSTR